MSKVKIYTWADKAPEFIYKQYESIKRFVKDDNFEFIVFNNVPFPKLKRQKQIKTACKKLGIKCLDVRFRSFVSGASYITGWGILWAYHRFMRFEKDVIHVILDSDMFFIKDINFNDYLGENQIAAIHQRRDEIEYLWNGFVVMKGGELPDKNHFDYRLDTINGTRTDTGGRTYFWLKRNPNLKIKWIKHSASIDISKSNILPEKYRKNYNPDYCFQIIEDFILHYRAGSNWEKKDQNFVNTKKKFFYNLLEDLISGKEEINKSEYKYIIKQGG